DLASKERFHILYLAFFMLKHKDYEKSLQYFNMVHQLKPFSEDERHIFKEIYPIKDSNPLGISLKLRSWILLDRNVVLFPRANLSPLWKDFKKNIINFLNDY